MNAKKLVFLREASNATLEQYELSKRNEAAELAKQLRALLWEVADALADAELARKAREARLCSPDDKEEWLPFDSK